MLSPAVWVARVQGAALAILAVVLLVVGIVNRNHRIHTHIVGCTGPAAHCSKLILSGVPVALLASEIVLAVMGAVLLTGYAGHRRARTPILLLELIAVGVSTQLFRDSRPLVSLAVGVPALAASVFILLGVNNNGGERDPDPGDPAPAATAR